MGKTSTRHLYALALGSNRPLSARRTPARLLGEAVAGIAALGNIRAVAPLLTTPPMGPSRRVFANGALLLESILPPDAMLRRLQDIERQLGRRRFRRWGARSVDIDIILWSGGRWNNRSLHIPHPAFRERAFVLTPLAAIAPDWRDPVSGHCVRHLRSRLQKATPIMRSGG
ncbi:2-amino-4-hydroxy-6-hydroxymethyldihydropteridine diphosphokinase [Sphingobium sp. LB126]|uniref:2-amino-4-hydroxy-6- hydroxymethyldihydropteridine diphosphokinase n=1 Tax=Sphingobium sp. LB126 TaxID=1983755 RepID=UPI000C20A05D|nr:2-amino-4-hydroxy-6-hydroxymethyldihydropteridine diphosphokinase [Sphingobium sp. LB126]PJG49897.1 2-amino-4-hydroxy-6-hydroxymethyldihydropteridine diphosphokinase [Sphingobium sp. LB126]